MYTGSTLVKYHPFLLICTNVITLYLVWLWNLAWTQGKWHCVTKHQLNRSQTYFPGYITVIKITIKRKMQPIRVLIENTIDWSKCVKNNSSDVSNCQFGFALLYQWLTQHSTLSYIRIDSCHVRTPHDLSVNK